MRREAVQPELGLGAAHCVRLAAAGLPVGEARGALSVEESLDQRPSRSLVHLTSARALAKELVEAKRVVLELTLEVDLEARLV